MASTTATAAFSSTTAAASGGGDAVYVNVGVTALSTLLSPSSAVSSLSSESTSTSTSKSSSSASAGTATAAMPRVPMVRRPLPPKVKRSASGGDE
jgi:hypothetical protein